MRCSILLLEDDGVTLRHGAAPSLPAHYCDAIDGLRIGPKVGSCGTAAYTNRTVIVTDIEHDELWADFRAIALPLGLRACWSTPVNSSASAVLGTFAMYYDQPRSPSENDLAIIRTAALLAGALIERERLQIAGEADRRALADANSMLEEQQMELEMTNQQLQDATVEQEMLNQQLQENAAELEMQTEALELANHEFRASEERLRDIFEQATVALAVLEGPTHIYTVVSPRFLEYTGASDITGRRADEVGPGLVSADSMELLDRIYQSGEPHNVIERRVALDRNGDGEPEEYFFNVAYTPLRDRTGKVYAIVSASLDVTGQVAARRDLEAARRDAEEANRAKSQFLATMSHELRTPLNAISGYADLLLAGVRGELTPDQRSDVERLRRSGSHLLSLINDILNFAKLEAGTVEFHVADILVASLLESLEELVRPQVDTKSLAYSHRLPNRELAVRADGEKVRQILLNLVTNAVKFTESGGQIDVDCICDDRNVYFVVRDTGRGIPDEHLSRIFDPFVQIDRDRTPRSQQGVGLGLSISRDLAQGMGGSLTATSALGKGSTFKLTLPRPHLDAPGDARYTNSLPSA